VTPFDYFMVFVTIIIALAIESVAKDVDTLIAAKRRVKWHWMAPVTAVNSILLILSQFFLLWELRAHSPFNTYLHALSPVTTMLMLFLTASAALPSDVPAEGLDLKEWYFGNRARYWGLTIALMGCFVFTNGVAYFTHAVPGWQALALSVEAVTAALFAASLIWSKAVWWHSVVIVLFFVTSLAGNAGLTLS
jgi:hypothetical protein